MAETNIEPLEPDLVKTSVGRFILFAPQHMWRCFLMKLQTKDLVLMAVYAALFIVLDYLANLLPKMPNGGSFGLGVIPLLLASYHLGWKKGIAVGLLSIPLQYMTGQIWFLDFGQFTLDYIIAFGIYGIASLLPNYKMFFSGVLITNGVRFISSTLSGMWYFGLPLWESGAYNATYMVPTTLACLVFVPLVYVRISRFIKKA